MNNRRDLLLQQMGISQWQLSRPELLKGSVQINVAPDTRLIIISDQTINKSAVLLQDILRAINIPLQHCLFIKFEQISHLVASSQLIYWLLSDNPPLIEQTQSLCSQPYTIWQTPSWQNFSHNPLAKRQLWQTIYQSLQDEE